MATVTSNTAWVASSSGRRSHRGTAAAVPVPRQAGFRLVSVQRAACSVQRVRGQPKRGPCVPRAESPVAPGAPDDEALASVARAGRDFRKLGYISFWTQLVLSVVSSVILMFSIAFGEGVKARRAAQFLDAFLKVGRQGANGGTYLTFVGVLCSFLSVFWSFGYTRLGARLRKYSITPTQAPPRAEVIKNLTSGVSINIAGLGATILGLEATVGLLVAKTLTTAASNPFVSSRTYNPVLALDVFLVQAATNTALSCFAGAVISLWLLRSVSSPFTPAPGSDKAAA